MSWKKYLVENWNIGFSNSTAEELIEKQSLGKITWMRHPYKDRFFADPFIVKISNGEITVWAEEVILKKHKGCIVELIVDEHSKRLKERHLLLELNTHLSYPIYTMIDDEIFVYPENSESGQLALYKYNSQLHQLEKLKTIIEEPLVDATMLNANNSTYLFASKVPHTHDTLYLYKAPTIDGSFTANGCIKKDINSSRPAGNFFWVNGNLYRSAQNCKTRYGSAIEIMKVIELDPYKEAYCFTISPTSFKYNLGLHTLNFHNDTCIIDGYGYYSPIIGRIIYFMSTIKSILRSK